MPRIKNVSVEQAEQRGKRLQYIQKLAGISRSELCEGTPHKPDTVYRWEKGRNQGVNEKAATNFSERLRTFGIVCTPEWLLYGDSPEPHKISDIVGTKESSTLELDKIQKEQALFESLYINTLSIQLSDDTMGPSYRSGDFVGGILLEQENYEKAVGSICLVRLVKHKTILLRKVEWSQRPGCFNILCTQPDQRDPLVIQDVELGQVAPLIWWRRPVFNTVHTIIES